MENKALLWFKPNKIGWLMLRQNGLEEQQWKKLHCMIKGNYFFYIIKLNRPEPQGILPLEGCVAEISHQSDYRPNFHCFIVIMKKPIFEEKVQIHSNYMFATQTMEDCQQWVDAINTASISPHIARLKLEFAKQDVEESMICLRNLQKINSQKLKSEEYRTMREEEDEEEDPYILQALANQLMELYHSMNLAQDSKSAAQKQIYATQHYITKLQEAIIALDESIEGPTRALIQNDIKKVNEKLKEITYLRCSIRDVAKEIEVLNGNHEYGPQVHVMSTCQSTLRNTLKKIKRLREETVLFSKEFIPSNEAQLLELCHKVNLIYENERALLQEALPKEKVEISAQQGRHYFCSLASYALVPILENHIQRMQDSPPLPQPKKPNTRWWITNKIISLFSSHKPSSPIQKSNILLIHNNQEKETDSDLNIRAGSLILPHLEMGIDETLSQQTPSEHEHIQNNEHDRDPLLSSMFESNVSIKEINKDGRVSNKGRDSVLSIRSAYHEKNKKNQDNNKGIRQEGYSLLPMIDKGKEIENNVMDSKEEESSSTVVNENHSKREENENDDSDIEEDKGILLRMINGNYEKSEEIDMRETEQRDNHLY